MSKAEYRQYTDSHHNFKVKDQEAVGINNDEIGKILSIVQLKTIRMYIGKILPT